jgi:beta-lactamase regulating signal transducer with metallopeptidase domain
MGPWATRWLFDTALSAGAILLLGSILIALLKQPARRQRVGEWTLLACLIVAVLQAVNLPRVSLGWVEHGAGTGLVQRDMRGVEAFSEKELAGDPNSKKTGVTAGATNNARERESAMVAAWNWAGANWALILVGGYAAAMCIAAARLLMGHRQLAKMVRTAANADGVLAAMWSDMTDGLQRPARLKVSKHVNRPICFGVFKPVVLLPKRLAESAGGRRWEEVRIILLHELVHVRRRDAVTWMLASLAGVVFFYQPLLWHLQKQLRMAQEFIADAWAAEHAGSPAAYAENLVRLLKENLRPVPMNVSAAVRGPSEFYRRMQRLLSERGETEKACAKKWSVLGGAVVLSAAILCCGISVQAARAPAESNANKKISAEERGIRYLLSRQEKSGGWISEFGPAPTAMIIRSLLQHGESVDSAAVKKGLEFLEKFRQRDNGYYADTEPTYNTAIVLSTLAMIPGEKYAEAIEAGKKFLEIRRRAEETQTPGGWYATQTPAATARPKWLDPSERSADAILETYGSMSYAGLKSMVYAGLSKDDSRVRRSAEWIRGNWTLENNPGVGTPEGLFYYYHLMAKALRARGEDQLVDARGKTHDWRAELSDQLSGLQRADGSWVNSASGRWLEDKPELVTAYAVLALQETRTK